MERLFNPEIGFENKRVVWMLAKAKSEDFLVEKAILKFAGNVKPTIVSPEDFSRLEDSIGDRLVDFTMNFVVKDANQLGEAQVRILKLAVEYAHDRFLITSREDQESAEHRRLRTQLVKRFGDLLLEVKIPDIDYEKRLEIIHLLAKEQKVYMDKGVDEWMLRSFKDFRFIENELYKISCLFPKGKPFSVRDLEKYFRISALSDSKFAHISKIMRLSKQKTVEAILFFNEMLTTEGLPMEERFAIRGVMWAFYDLFYRLLSLKLTELPLLQKMFADEDLYFFSSREMRQKINDFSVQEIVNLLKKVARLAVCDYA